MNLFGRNQRRKRGESGGETGAKAGETAPGLRVMKELWDISPKKRVERVEGEVVTDIYATQRPNGVPRRRNPQHRPRPNENGEFTPPY
ncbi:MAG TPA: hypothetical protein PKE12_12295 [Kiritimatiellia bacterium]|nr:hypothetical protein [Kiritimatiellia bacterium]